MFPKNIGDCLISQKKNRKFWVFRRRGNTAFFVPYLKTKFSRKIRLILCEFPPTNLNLAFFSDKVYIMSGILIRRKPG